MTSASAAKQIGFLRNSYEGIHMVDKSDSSPL